jgi:hypothetical protein
MPPALSIDGPAAIETLKRDWRSPKKIGAALDVWSKQQHPSLEVVLATIAGSGQVKKGRGELGGRRKRKMRREKTLEKGERGVFRCAFHGGRVL